MNSRKYRLTFFVSVSFIGAMFIFYFLSLQNALNQNKDNAAIINVAGRQRMFSQKITQLTLRLFYDTSEKSTHTVQKDLSATLARFTNAHYTLLDPAKDVGVDNTLNDSLTLAYFASIEDARQRLITNAYSIGFDGEKEPSRLAMLFKDQRLFLSGMDEVVNRYEYNSSAQNDRLINRACKKYKVFQQINKPITIQRLFDALSQVNQQQEDIPTVVASAPAPSATAKGQSLSILIVDDNHVNVILARELVNNILDQVEIHTAANGKSAVDQFQEVQPDLVLMDIQMPILNGYQATQAIRESERNGRTPIIALTAGTIKGERERYLEAGMDDYLSKPITANQLKEMLEKWLKLRQEQDTEEPGEASSIIAPKASTAVFNRSTLLERFGGNEAIVQEVIEEIWSIIRSGELRKDAEALQLAFENGAPEQEIKAHAHKIKGTGLNASFDRLAKYAIELEKLSP